MTKDYTFALFFMLWTIGFGELVRTRCKAADSKTFSILYVLVGLLAILSKKPGIYIIVLATVVLLLVYRKQALKAALLGFASAFSYVVVFELVVFSLCGVQTASSADMWSLSLQQTARTVTLCGDQISDEDKAAISAVLDYDQLPAIYNPTLSDPVKNQFGNSASTTSQKVAYLGTWARMFFEHPVVYAEATLANTYEAIYPFAPMDQFEGIDEGWSRDQWLVDYFLAYETYPEVTADQVRAELNSLSSSSTLAGARGVYGKYVAVFTSNPVLLFLISKGLYAFWLPLFVVGYLLYRKEYRGIIAVVPVILCFLVLVASPVTQSRYFTPSLYCAVVMMSLVFGAFAPTKSDSIQKKNTANSLYRAS